MKLTNERKMVVITFSSSEEGKAIEEFLVFFGYKWRYDQYRPTPQGILDECSGDAGYLLYYDSPHSLNIMYCRADYGHNNNIQLSYSILKEFIEP